MTTPEAMLERAPVIYGCNACGSLEVATLSLYGGRRCANHPDEYDPQITMKLRLHGFADTADAYKRTFFPDA
jgi:hypothetical protein